MLPFQVEFSAGESPYREIVYAATRAVVSGELPIGAPFPSVRVLSQSLKINPNTAQKAVAQLVREGLLEVRPGIGTVVAQWGPTTAQERRALLAGPLERLIVEARRLGVTRRDLQEAVAEQWADLFGDEISTAGPAGGDPAREESSGEESPRKESA